MSRRKKLALSLLGVVVVCAMLGYVFRFSIGGWLIAELIGAFDPAKAPPAPNYAEESAWAALPGRDNASDRIPAGLVETTSPRHEW